MRLGLRGRMLGASAAVAVLVGAGFVLLFDQAGKFQEESDLARRTAEVTSAANRLEALAIDLQTGARGFVVTRDERFLEPTLNARAELGQQRRELESLILDAEQKELARALGEQIEAYDREVVEPQVATARSDPERASEVIEAGEGKRRVDAIRAGFERFRRGEDALALEREQSTDARGRTVRAVSLGALGASVLMLLIFAIYLSRSIVAPIRGTAAAAGRLRDGDLSARVQGRAVAEIGELARAFNAMGESLQESRDELESQNRELETQQTELEAQQAELETATVELEEQRAELERTVDELAFEKERVESLYEFGRALAEQTEEGSLAETVIRGVAEIAGAELGALYVLQEDATYRPVMTLGLDESRLAAVRAGDGLPGRALADLQPVRAAHGETGLRVPAFGADVAVGAELHVPLAAGGRAVGVVTLARVGDRPFTDADVAAVEVLADQAGVALSNVLAYAEAQHHASITKAVLDAAVDGIFMVDLEGKLVLHNSVVAGLAAQRGSALEGNAYEGLEASAETSTDPDRAREFWRSVAADPDLAAAEELTAADTGRTVVVHTAPVRGDEGELLGRIFTLRDVTTEREADKLKSELVATVSHELRTPLASILGFSELLVHRDLDADTKDSYLATIHNEARRLTALIDEFLDLQRIEEGRFTLALESFDLGSLLRHEAELFSGQSASHELELELPEGEFAVLGERDRVAQVLANLISNAIKYSPAGGTVSIAASAGNGFVRVSVTDRGLGIPQDQQPQIFTKFFRADTSDTREIGGTGLGLALAKEIVEAHGGRIDFESVEGAGSTFWFELPSGERAGGARSRHVLVIEDDPSAARLLADYLAEDGYSVTIAATGEEGLARAAASAPDLVCLDIGLPGELDGWQVLERLKAAKATAVVPVLICTGNNGRERAAALGAADFLTKPFSPGQLRETIGRILPERSGTILVVDDDPALRRLVTESLGGDGFSLEEAGDGGAALEAMAERRPDAIVLDLVMPGLDGFALLERLQADAGLRDIPVVVLTAKRLSAGERARLTTQAVSLLEKSAYSPQELRRLVNQALGR